MRRLIHALPVDCSITAVPSKRLDDNCCCKSLDSGDGCIPCIIPSTRLSSTSSSSSPTIRSSSTLVIIDVFAIHERKNSACFFLCSFVGRECPDARKAASCCGYGLIVVLAGHKRSRPPAPTHKKKFV